MKLKRLAYLAFTFSIPCFLQAQQAKMNIGIEAGQLNFDVSFKGQPVILSSPLGMNIDNHLLGKEVKNSTVSTTSGKYKTYTIEQKDGNTYYIDSWEFDDGVALLITHRLEHGSKIGISEIPAIHGCMKIIDFRTGKITVPHQFLVFQPILIPFGISSFRRPSRHRV